MCVCVCSVLVLNGQTLTLLLSDSFYPYAFFAARQRCNSSSIKAQMQAVHGISLVQVFRGERTPLEPKPL